MNILFREENDSVVEYREFYSDRCKQNSLCDKAVYKGKLVPPML